MIDFILNKNKDQLKKDLIFYAFFLMTFENFFSQWKEQLQSFFADSFHEKNGKIVFDFVKTSVVDAKAYITEDEKAKEKYEEIFRIVNKSNKKNGYDKTLSMFKWMEIHKFIDNKDYEKLTSIRELRNEIAHNLEKCLEKGVSDNDKNLLDSLLKIRKKASERWIREIEIPIAGDEHLDENGNFQSPVFVTSLNDVIIDIIKDSVLT